MNIFFVIIINVLKTTSKLLSEWEIFLFLKKTKFTLTDTVYLSRYGSSEMIPDTKNIMLLITFFCNTNKGIAEKCTSNSAYYKLVQIIK